MIQGQDFAAQLPIDLSKRGDSGRDIEVNDHVLRYDKFVDLFADLGEEVAEAAWVGC